MNILQQLFGYVALYFIARYMGPGPLGIVASALAFASTLNAFGDFGYSIAHVKKVSEGVDLKKCIGVYTWTKLFLTLLIALFTLIIVLLFPNILGDEFKLPVNKLVFIIIAMGVLWGNITQIIQYTFAARIEKVKEWSSLITNKIVTSSLKTLSAIFGLGVIGLAFSGLIGAISGFLVAIWFFRKQISLKFDKKLFKDYTRFAVPSFFIGISSTLMLQLDKVFISALTSSQQVGYYSASQSIVIIVGMISTVFISLLLPTYSRLSAENKTKEIGVFANRIEKYLSFPLMAFGTFIFLFSSPIQTLLLGAKFSASSPIIKILIINAVVLIFSQPYSAQIMGMNRMKAAMMLSTVVLLTNVIFYFILIPESILNIQLFGMKAQGAALSLLISNLLGTIIARSIAFRLTNSTPNYTIVGHLLTAILVFTSLYWLVKDWTIISNFFFLVSMAVLGGVIYLLILIITKQLNVADFIFYIDALNLKKLGKYVKSELSEY